MANEPIERISPEAARERMAQGGLLVCAYEDEARCRQAALPGAITLAELRERQQALSKDTPLVFYCA